jgi:hypothetical protein
LPQNNILGLPTNVTTQAIADGNWVFLKPLSPGSHKIVFKGEVQKQQQQQQQQLQTNTIAGVNANTVSGSNGTFAFTSGWNFETTYDLTVNIDATNGYSHSSSNQSLIIDQLNRITTTAAQHNVVKLLADMVRNRLHDAVKPFGDNKQRSCYSKCIICKFYN